MPIFEYRCEKCGDVFDHFFRSLEEESRFSMACPRCGSDRLRKPRFSMACPRCGSDRLRKLVSAFGLGSGAGDSGGCSSADSFKSG